MTDYKLIDNTAESRYEFRIDDLVVVADYNKTGKGEILITHVGVPPQLEGQGIGSQLVKKMLADIKQQGLTVVPVCPFVDNYIQRHPEWKELL